MNTRAALNGAFHGLRSTRGKQSSFAHALLHGLEALADEAAWRTPYCGGNDMQPVHRMCGELALAWTDVVWRRGHE